MSLIFTNETDEINGLNNYFIFKFDAYCFEWRNIAMKKRVRNSKRKESGRIAAINIEVTEV